MTKVKDKANFNFSKETVIEILNNSKYEGRSDEYDTYLKQDAGRWEWGKKYAFQETLVNKQLKYFAYIKFYIDGDNKAYALVAGKSGSKTVNIGSGCDLLFSVKPGDGQARQWLAEHNKVWDQTKILVVRTIAEGKKESRKEALQIERFLQETFDLFGS